MSNIVPAQLGRFFEDFEVGFAALLSHFYDTIEHSMGGTQRWENTWGKAFESLRNDRNKKLQYSISTLTTPFILCVTSTTHKLIMTVNTNKTLTLHDAPPPSPPNPGYVYLPPLVHSSNKHSFLTT